MTKMRLRGELLPVVFEGASAGEFREFVAIVMIVGKSAKFEIVPDAVVAQLDLRARARDFRSTAPARNLCAPGSDQANG